MSKAFPDVAVSNQDGDMIRSWFEFDSGDSGPGTIVGQFRAAGETAWGTATTFKDDSGTDIHVAENGWGNVQKAYSGDSAWTMAIFVDGETDISVWCCWNESDLTWKCVS